MSIFEGFDNLFCRSYLLYCFIAYWLCYRKFLKALKCRVLGKRIFVFAIAFVVRFTMMHTVLNKRTLCVSSGMCAGVFLKVSINATIRKRDELVAQLEQAC